jgi:hypothetical protein
VKIFRDALTPRLLWWGIYLEVKSLHRVINEYASFKALKAPPERTFTSLLA